MVSDDVLGFLWGQKTKSAFMILNDLKINHLSDRLRAFEILIYPHMINNVIVLISL